VPDHQAGGRPQGRQRPERYCSRLQGTERLGGLSEPLARLRRFSFGMA
jgi:hypothetical protein